MSTNTLTDKLAALPGATASATNHASVGYDLSVALPESSLLAAATIMDEAGYFLECMTGVDWLGAVAWRNVGNATFKAAHFTRHCWYFGHIGVFLCLNAFAIGDRGHAELHLAHLLGGVVVCVIERAHQSPHHGHLGFGFYRRDDIAAPQLGR